MTLSFIFRYLDSKSCFVKPLNSFVDQKIPLVIAGRRPGDAEVVYASTERAESELNWK